MFTQCGLNAISDRLLIAAAFGHPSIRVGRKINSSIWMSPLRKGSNCARMHLHGRSFLLCAVPAETLISAGTLLYIGQRVDIVTVRFVWVVNLRSVLHDHGDSVARERILCQVRKFIRS
jgi:hypothetical protein